MATLIDKKRKKHPSKLLKGNSGFIIADFLFAFVMVIGIGIFIFALTFSLATIEVAQYIVWSTARNYSAANINDLTAKQNAQTKFENLTAAFPLLTGAGEANSPWFRLSVDTLQVGDLSLLDTELQNSLSGTDLINEYRQPWTGASARLNLILFSNLKIPFLGPVAGDNKSLFEFPVRAFIIRHPSQEDCKNFFYRERYPTGIKNLENSGLAPLSSPTLNSQSSDPSNPTSNNGFGEDNGC